MEQINFTPKIRMTYLFHFVLGQEEVEAILVGGRIVKDLLIQVVNLALQGQFFGAFLENREMEIRYFT